MARKIKEIAPLHNKAGEIVSRFINGSVLAVIDLQLGIREVFMAFKKLMRKFAAMVAAGIVRVNVYYG